MTQVWNDEDTFIVTEAAQMLRKASDALTRVRELADKYSKENLVSPFPEMARQIYAALDGETDGTL